MMLDAFNLFKALCLTLQPRAHVSRSLLLPLFYMLCGVYQLITHILELKKHNGNTRLQFTDDKMKFELI
jgi:hypothetical protein